MEGQLCGVDAQRCDRRRRLACSTASPMVIRERIGAGRDDGATAGVALRVVEVFGVVRR